MADERWRIPVDSNYAHALGVAIYCWAYADYTAERYGVALAEGPFAAALALMEKDIHAARPATVDGRQRLVVNGKAIDLYRLERIADTFARRAIAIIAGPEAALKSLESADPNDPQIHDVVRQEIKIARQYAQDKRLSESGKEPAKADD